MTTWYAAVTPTTGKQKRARAGQGDAPMAGGPGARGLDEWAPGAPLHREAIMPCRYGGKTFVAELDVAELDDRMRPGPAWGARGRELSRSILVFMSRRMVHAGRLLLVAVHLIDDRPVPLFGRVAECEYEAEGLHKVVMDLAPVPPELAVHDWLGARGRL